MVSIYMLTDPTGADSCYVGATAQPIAARVKQHMTDLAGNSRQRKAIWLRMLKAKHLMPVVTVLDTVDVFHREEAEQDAIAMVAAVRGANCLNTLP